MANETNGPEATDAAAWPSPRTVLDARYGEPAARATRWSAAVEALGAAELFSLTTLRAGQGGPHTTPLLAVWSRGALHFCTGAGEQKARNLAADPRVSLLTGANALHGGLDLVVEGEAVRVTDPGSLRVLARAWEEKYGAEWHFDVGDGVFVGARGNEALVFRVAPSRAYGFGKAPYSQTRWDFGRATPATPAAPEAPEAPEA
ncbi:pyridoxamine 5'-phosphate oxidase family protein [Streptomyces sp. NRRL F-5126]|uniref:pyridoxamine 5'-phosphate oxidase family protein n=1 Tax=Streptomyces sp. NRRL F-5126 TaxID=1463857 RepID=UPI00068B77B1|nr:pyridoxamine 5'-phosphate oxidase family protein [Streptomyces sp. NRRL F-5126]